MDLPARHQVVRGSVSFAIPEKAQDGNNNKVNNCNEEGHACLLKIFVDPDLLRDPFARFEIIFFSAAIPVNDSINKTEDRAQYYQKVRCCDPGISQSEHGISPHNDFVNPLQVKRGMSQLDEYFVKIVKIILFVVWPIKEFKKSIQESGGNIRYYVKGDSIPLER
jgi:hypothetical protein